MFLLLIGVSVAKSYGDQLNQNFEHSRGFMFSPIYAPETPPQTDIRVYVEENAYIVIELDKTKYFTYIITTDDGHLVARGRITSNKILQGPLASDIYIYRIS